MARRSVMEDVVGGATTAADHDTVNRTIEQLGRYAEILRPEDVDEPILSPVVGRAVHEWIVELNNEAELRAAGVQPRRLALLYGPPGTGKTTLAHHLAARLGLPLIAAQSERIVGKYLGETGSNLGAMFDLLKQVERHCVLLLDEFDAIAQKRRAADSSATQDQNQALTVLLRRIEGFRGVGLAATNTKDSLDVAMWRRFGLHISVDLPGENERFAILRKYALPYDLDDAGIDALVSATRGCSPSLLRQLMEGMKRLLILAPKLPRVDVSTAAVVFEHVIASITPPPEMEQPPLWSGTRSLDSLKDITWPPAPAGRKG